MVRTTRSTLVFALGVCLSIALGCDGSSGDGGDGGSGGNGSGANGSGANGSGANGSGANGAGAAGAGTTAPQCETECSAGDECPNLVCECKDGSVINTKSCNNGCCEVEAGACPGACKDNGGWGSSGNGGGGQGGGEPTGAGFGESCSSNSDCESGQCFPVYPDDEDTLECTITCSFGGGECPSGYDCAEINGGQKYLCVK